ncbi:MAG: hypothetical protein E2600_12130 [Chryseobacterium sp.]|nr:hypothetical protein [Chryseobacterium sp.]
MKIVTDLNRINWILEDFKGDKAQLWLYDITHKKIAIRLSIKDKDDVIYLIISSCEYIRGVFSWDNPSFYVDKYKNEKKNENIYRLMDINIDFLLEGKSGIALAKGFESDFGISFENFLNGK